MPFLVQVATDPYVIHIKEAISDVLILATVEDVDVQEFTWVERSTVALNDVDRLGFTQLTTIDFNIEGPFFPLVHMITHGAETGIGVLAVEMQEVGK